MYKKFCAPSIPINLLSRYLKNSCPVHGATSLHFESFLVIIPPYLARQAISLTQDEGIKLELFIDLGFFDVHKQYICITMMNCHIHRLKNNMHWKTNMIFRLKKNLLFIFDTYCLSKNTVWLSWWPDYSWPWWRSMQVYLRKNCDMQ